MTGSYDAAPEAAPLLTDRDWLRLRFIRHLVGAGRFAPDIGADSPFVSVRDLIARRSFDPAQAGSA